MKALNALGTVSVFMMLLAIVSFEMNKVILSMIPPVSYESIKAAPSKVQAGGMLNIEFTITRKRHCRVHLDMFIKAADNKIIMRKSVVGGASDLGTEDIKTSHFVPDTAKPGEHEFITRGFYDCYEGMHVVHFPTAKFTVIP